MILSVDNIPVVAPDPLQNLTCFLCNSIISFINKNPSKLFHHLQVQHDIHINHDLLLLINLFDIKLIGEAISSFNNLSEADNFHSISAIKEEDKTNVPKPNEEEYEIGDSEEAVIFYYFNESCMPKK